MIDWATFEFDDGSLEKLNDAEPGEFSIRKQIDLWADAVEELERGMLWVLEDLEAACANRDDVEGSVAALIPGALRDQLVSLVDALDARFANSTASVTQVRESPDNREWWWAVEPRRIDQRQFLRENWNR